MSMISKECEQCGTAFEARCADLKRGRARFCSRKCSGAHRSANTIEKEPNVECAKCGKGFYKTESKQKKSKSGLFFCTRTCKDSAQTIGNGGIKKIMPPHYGNGNNYRRICFSHHKKECIICGEDKVVAVHHYDENHNNNDLNNLIPLCPTHHLYVHSKYKVLVMEKIDKWKREQDFKKGNKK